MHARAGSAPAPAAVAPGDEADPLGAAGTPPASPGLFPARRPAASGRRPRGSGPRPPPPPEQKRRQQPQQQPQPQEDAAAAREAALASPAAPLHLPDAEYRVIKINQRGRRQRRVLRLLAESLQNVRKGKVTANVAYAEIFCVTLQDHQTLTVEVAHARDRDLTYESPAAMQIVQDVNRRIALRLRNEKRALTYNLASLAARYQERLAEWQSRDLSDEIERATARATTHAAASVTVSGSRSDMSSLESILDGSDADDAGGDGEDEDDDNGGAGDGGDGDGASSSTTTSSCTNTTAAASSTTTNTNKDAATDSLGDGISSLDLQEEVLLRARDNVLLRVLRQGADTPAPAEPAAAPAGKVETQDEATAADADAARGLPVATEEERLKEAIDRMVLDPSTEEGRVRARFLKNFNALERKPDELLDTTRQFLASLTQYMETKRADELAELLLKLRPERRLRAQRAALNAVERSERRRRQAEEEEEEAKEEEERLEREAEEEERRAAGSPGPGRGAVFGAAGNLLDDGRAGGPENDIVLETDGDEAPRPSERRRRRSSSSSAGGAGGGGATGGGAGPDDDVLAGVGYELIHADDLGVDVPALIGRSLEGAVVMPLYQRVLAVLRPRTAERDDVLQRKMARLRMREQSYFGIAAAQLSSTNWSSARYELSFLERKVLPCDKLDVLTGTARAIYNSYNYERNKAADRELRAQRRADPARFTDREYAERLGKVENFLLAADEFFPIFVYVVVHAKVQLHELSKRFMWGLCNQASLAGESGYYLTVYEAALEYVATLTEEQLAAKTLQGGRRQ